MLACAFQGDYIMILNGKKDHRLEELKKVVDSIINRLESRYNDKLSTLNSQRNQLNQVDFIPILLFWRINILGLVSGMKISAFFYHNGVLNAR